MVETKVSKNMQMTEISPHPFDVDTYISTYFKVIKIIIIL